ncbi:signal peptidase I [bacterium]|nr:signal peptidase I [bacterium]
MTSEEFKEALSVILKYKEEKKEEEKPQTNSIDEFKQNIENFKNFLSEPLTQEVFIRRGKKVKSWIWELVSTIVFVLVAVIIIRYFIAEIRWIPSGSMRPTLIEGDRVVVNRFSRFFTLPQRGDIMIFYPPEEKLENTFGKVMSRLIGIGCKDIAYIKRVIGLPGDKFEIKQDDRGVSTVYINDEPLNEPYIKNPLEYPECTENMLCGPIYIPEGQYFMMGDNRGNSRDSRYWGLLPQDRFIGKAIIIARINKL